LHWFRAETSRRKFAHVSSSPTMSNIRKRTVDLCVIVSWLQAKGILPFCSVPLFQKILTIDS
jgi:hypothetical protein